MDECKCTWCGKEAVRYCDAVIGVEPEEAIRDKSNNVIGLLSGIDGDRWTCDAPMCEDHVHQVGWISGSDADSIDHCPHHKKNPEKPMRDLLMFKGEVENKRRSINSEIRRSLMRCIA